MFCGFCDIYYDGQRGILIVFGGFYDDKANTFCMGFTVVYNLYIKEYRSDVSKNYNVGEHMEF